jgi:hypothetical protein
MFEKLYPDAFVKRVRRSPTKSYGIDTVKIILKGLLENIMSSHSGGLSLDRAEGRIMQYLNGNGIRNISMYFDGPYLDMMQDNLTLRDRYVKANKYVGLFDNIRRGKYDLDVDDEEPQQHDENYDVPDFESKAAASIYESFKSKPSGTYFVPSSASITFGSMPVDLNAKQDSSPAPAVEPPKQKEPSINVVRRPFYGQAITARKIPK